MKKTIFFIILNFLFIGSFSLFAQTINSNTINDSLNNAILKEYNKKLVQFEVSRVADSIEKSKLESKLNSLKTTDNFKKEDLLKQLKALKNKESERILQKKTRIDSLRIIGKGYPVKGFFKDTLFIIYNKLGGFSTQERAEAISNRIKNLGTVFTFKPNSLKINKSETTEDLVFEETVIMSITENDALWNDTTPDKLAKSYKAIIVRNVIKYKSETSFSELAKEIGLALLVIIITWLLLFYIRKLFNWTALKLQLQENKKIKGIKIRDYTLFDSKQEIRFLLNINKIFKWFLILLIIYIALPILFGIFPWTKDFADTLFGYVFNPVKKIMLGFWNYLPNLITIIVIVFVFHYMMRGIHFLKTEIEKDNLHLPGFYPDWANPTYQIIRVLVFAFLIVVIFPYLPGSDSPVFRGVSVFLGFLFTFGSAGSLSNIISGLVLTYMRLFKIGDRVKVGDVTGDVIEKSLLVTRIRTIKNEVVSIPNSTVMSTHTINYSSDAINKGLILHTTVTIGYDVPWKTIHKALIDSAKKTEFVLQFPIPFVLQTSLDDFYVSYQINAYTNEANKQALIYSNLHQNIQDICNERGIEIMSPHYLAARDGNKTTIPLDYLDKNYQSPSFNINQIKKNKPQN